MKKITTICIAVAAITFVASASAQSVVVGWDTNGVTGYGANGFGPTTRAANLDSVVGFTRGPGVGTSGTGAAGGWGGTDWVATSQAAAVTAGDYVTFSLSPATGYSMSLSSVTPFEYRRSGTGPTSGALEYSLNGGTFTTISTFTYPVTTSGGGSIGAISLSGFSDLQNIPDSTTVTFRIVNWGASGTAGTWYIFDRNNGDDFAITGTVVPEPGTVIGALLGVCGLCWHQRRRFSSVLQKRRLTLS